MKRVLFLLGISFVFNTVIAQNSYIVKTHGATNQEVKGAGQYTGADGESDQGPDFVRDNFKFYSLCDWQEGMKFMVMPERYDLIVNTFIDASTNKEASSGALRYKIMIYKGHSVAADGSARVNFLCQDDNKMYYYQIPNGSFEDYCYGKLGVPTLAFLGDVDIARAKLIGAKVYTKADLYYVDSNTTMDAVEEVVIPKNTEATVVAVGVGTRSFPVKIIAQDAGGNQFFEDVAISRTNSGMRDDEFIMDNTRNTFYGAFEMADANVSAPNEYAKYVGKSVHTKYATKMNNKADKVVPVRKFSNFIIKGIQPSGNSNYVKMTLCSAVTGLLYTKQVTFINENVAGDIDGYKEDYYNYLFGSGYVGKKGVSKAHWTAIQKGRAMKGMNKGEVRMAKGDADKVVESHNGSVLWAYNDGTVVKFNKAGKAISVAKH